MSKFITLGMGKGMIVINERQTDEMSLSIDISIMNRFDILLHKITVSFHRSCRSLSEF